MPLEDVRVLHIRKLSTSDPEQVHIYKLLGFSFRERKSGCSAILREGRIVRGRSNPKRRSAGGVSTFRVPLMLRIAGGCAANHGRALGFGRHHGMEFEENCSLGKERGGKLQSLYGGSKYSVFGDIAGAQGGGGRCA